MAKKEPNIDNDNNNFFNKNPLITFAVFSVVMILLFKVLVGDGGGMDNGGIGGQTTRTKAVSYSELKALVASKSLAKVEIGQTYIKARSSDGQVYTTRIVRGDAQLVEELEKQGIEYTGFNESNWFTEMFGWLLPFLIDS